MNIEYKDLLCFFDSYINVVSIIIIYLYISWAKLQQLFPDIKLDKFRIGFVRDVFLSIFIHSLLYAISPVIASVFVMSTFTLIATGNEITFRRFARPASASDVRLIKAGLSFAGLGDLLLIGRWVLACLLAIGIETLVRREVMADSHSVFSLLISLGAFSALLVLGIGTRITPSPDATANHLNVQELASAGFIGAFGASLLRSLLWDRPKEGLQVPLTAAMAAPESISSVAPLDPLTGQEAPDVIIFVLESFFDIERSPFFRQRSLLPALRQLTSGHEAWEIASPVVGGKTANAEFEILTGIPLASLSSVDVPFRDLPLEKDEALPRLFRQLGYGTVAMHPGIRAFWNRDVAYPAMGFDRYLALEDFHGARRLGSYVHTDELVTKVEDFLATADGPQFVYAISILGHGPYDTDVEPLFPVDLPDGLSEEVRRYCHLLTHADAALGRLATFVKGRKRPTIALVLGDHAPGFAGTVGLAELGFDTRQVVSGEDKKPWAWTVPLIQISNMALPEPEQVRLPAYLLGPYLFGQLGLTGSSRTSLLSERLKGRSHMDAYTDPDLAPLAASQSFCELTSSMFACHIRTQALWSAFDEAVTPPHDIEIIIHLIDRFNEHLATYGEDVFTLYKKGILECTAGRFFDAERTLDRAIEMGGLDQFWSRYWRGRAYMGRKAFYHARRDFDECLQCLEMSIVELALESDPRQIISLNLQREVEGYLSILRTETANLYASIARNAADIQDIALYNFALEKVEPALPGTAAFIRGVYHMHEKEWEKAHAFFCVALDHNAEDFWSYIQRANCCVSLGHLKDAISDLDAAERVTPGTDIVRDIRATIQTLT